MSKLIKYFSPYLIAASVLIGLNLVYFSPELNGKIIHQPDMIKNAGIAHEARMHYEITGRPTYWTNSLFGGMPTYLFFAPSLKSGLFDALVKLFSLNFKGSIKYYLTLSLAAFLGLCFLGIGPWLALIGAYAIAFATNHIGLASAGHLTKIGTLGFIPMMLVGGYLIFNKNRKMGFLVFAFGLSGCIRMNHIQMTYYAGMLLFIFIMAETVSKIREKNVRSLVSPILLLLAGGMISFTVNYSTLMGLRSFAQDTIRGKYILSETKVGQLDSLTDQKKAGLNWKYATQWSASPSDWLAFLIPGALGGSSNEKWSKNSAMADAFRKNGIPVDTDLKLPMYWGKLPFTSGPDYLGVMIVLAFILGLILVKGTFKWFVLWSVLFILLQSLGHHFSFFNKFLFDYLPYYNKFRAPNSIFNILSILVPLFGIYGISVFIQQQWTRASILNLLKKSALPLGILLILIIIIGPGLFNMTSEWGDPDWKNNTNLYQVLLETRGDYLRSDALRSLVILAIGTALFYYFALKKVNLNDFLLVLGLLIGFDLWTVGKRYLSAEDFQANTYEQSNYQPRAVDLEILRDTSTSYRVLDLSVNTFSSAYPSYFHKSVGGENPAKLRRYQDMIDYYLTNNHMPSLNMLNTKYIINVSGSLQTNTSALGNAWFVSHVKKVNSPDEEIESINSINPAETAVFLPSDFNAVHLSDSYPAGGNIQLTDYLPDELTYQSSTTSEQLAVFSEIWYGPDKGWSVTIDNKPADHFRVNYILRAMLIPPGEHTIEFKFNPKALVAQSNVSFYAGSVFGLWLIISLGVAIRNFIRDPHAENQLEPLEIKDSTGPSKTNSRS